MSVYLYVTILLASALWCVPFLKAWRRRPQTQRVERQARWGIVIQCLGYSLLWQGSFWTRSPGTWRLTIGISLLAAACMLSRTSAHALGRHLRAEAALQTGHQLVTTGPYRFIRHPIYASMLCLLLGTGVWVAPLPLLLLALIVFLIGTEIRMRVEDSLLADRFGDDFDHYRRRVGRLIPFLR